MLACRLQYLGSPKGVKDFCKTQQDAIVNCCSCKNYVAIDRPAKSSVAAVLNVFAPNMDKTDPLFGVVVRGIFHISSEIIAAAVDVPDRLMFSKQATAFYKVFGTGSNNTKKWEQMAVDTATRNWVYPVNPQLGVAASPEPPEAEPGFPGIVVRISLDRFCRLTLMGCHSSSSTSSRRRHSRGPRST